MFLKKLASKVEVCKKPSLTKVVV